MQRAEIGSGLADVAGEIRDRLRAGRLIDDRVFDELFPCSVRAASSTHWTPIDAALRAARLLDADGGARILDIGSGVGKFCIVAAMATRARVVGVEHRFHLVDIAERVADSFAADVRFVRGRFTACDPRAVDGIYMFNPFAENVCSDHHRIDSTVELSEARFVRDTAAAVEFLREARIGTRVVTYCGFGGVMPAGYTLVLRERCSGNLELWMKDAED